MKNLLAVTTIGAIYSIVEAHAASAADLVVHYETKTVSAIEKNIFDEHVSIQELHILSIESLNEVEVKDINTHLRALTSRFAKRAKICLDSEPGDMWDYKIEFEKIVQSKNYLTTIFKEQVVCNGKPSQSKQAMTFAIKGGHVITTRLLFNKIFPSEINLYSVATDDLVRLDHGMFDKLITDSKTVLHNYDDKCESYLRTSAYQVWMSGDELLFFYPEYEQVYSGCQKEYVIRTRK